MSGSDLRQTPKTRYVNTVKNISVYKISEMLHKEWGVFMELGLLDNVTSNRAVRKRQV